MSAEPLCRHCHGTGIAYRPRIVRGPSGTDYQIRDGALWQRDPPDSATATATGATWHTSAMWHTVVLPFKRHIEAWERDAYTIAALRADPLERGTP